MAAPTVDPVSGIINAGSGFLGAVGGLLDHFILSPAQAAQFDLANRQVDLQGKALDVQSHAIDVARQETLYRISGRREQTTLLVIGLAVLAGGTVLTALAVKG